MFEDFKNILLKRVKVDNETPNWVYAIENCWAEEIEMFSKDINKTIDFLKSDCSAEEFSWLSEVFEDIAKKTQSKSFVDSLYVLAKKYPQETQKYNIRDFIESAEGVIENEKQ